MLTSVSYHRCTTEGTRECSFIHLLSKPPFANASLIKILKIHGPLLELPLFDIASLSDGSWDTYCYQVFFKNEHAEGSVQLCEKSQGEYWLLSLNSDGSAGSWLPLLLTLNFKCVLSPKMICLFFAALSLLNSKQNLGWSWKIEGTFSLR